MKHLPFRIFTLAVFLVLIIPLLVQDGMFMDGVLYAAVAKNQAEGFGNFWQPIFANTWNKHNVHTFHEHPPLVFGIQSLFFKIFGASIYVERFYSFLTAIFTVFLIHLNWKIIFQDQKELIKFSWLPILLWIIIPVCFWSFQNNMHENTMGIFTLISTYFLLKFYFQKQQSTLLILAGSFIFLASFSKGVPGFFPLAFPFLIWISHRKNKFVNIIHHTSLLGFSTFLCYAILMLYEPAKENLSFYFENRLMGRIDSDPTVGNRFYILGRLFQELLPPLILGGLILLFSKLKSNVITFKNTSLKNALLFFLLGFAGTLPLLLTMVQKGFYMVHALPYFGIGIAIIITPSLTPFFKNQPTKNKYNNTFTIISSLLLVGAILFSSLQFGKTKRDEDMLHDVYLLKNILPEKAHITLEKSIHQDWGLKVYLMRNGNFSTSNTINYPYFLVEKKKKNFMLEGYKKMKVGLKRYELLTVND
ncbi:MAG: ArnT family glycosyltransferase [Saprospiraceae bacterium]